MILALREGVESPVQAYRRTFDSVESCEPINYSYVMLFGGDDEAWRGWEELKRPGV